MKKFIAILLFVYCSYPAMAQSTRKVNVQSQSWFAILGQVKLNDKWSLLTDLILRRNDLFNDPSFSFIRVGIGRQVYKHFMIAGGYGHMWLAPAVAGWHTRGQEHRIYQQLQYTLNIGKINLIQRLRNEQRWQQKIVNDQRTNNYRFTDRIRYMAGLNIPVFRNAHLPSLSISDELLIHFGKEVVYNRLDQNRFFLGIKQKINKNWSADMGYMRVWQKKYVKDQFDLDHCFRLFFYYSSSFAKRSRQ